VHAKLAPDTPDTNELYASLDVETRIVVQQRTGEIKALMRRTAQDIVEIGQKLIEVKDRLEHGLFLSWLRVEFEWSVSAAYKFMQVAERFKFVNFTNLQFAPAALYLLAAPSTPKSAYEEALLRAVDGERVTHCVAKEIIAEHKPTPPPAGQDRTTRLPAFGHEGSNPSAEVDSAALVRESRSAMPAWDATEIAPTIGAPNESVGAAHKMSVHFSSQTVEHCTPANIIAPTLACLGEIDLDPCSEGGEPPNVPAHAHYTAADDGLAHSWHGRIYMNPPYGREISDWVEKLCSEYEVGQVTEAIALVPSRTDTRWWRRLREYPVCFVQGRLTFVGSQDPAPFPSAVFYLGRDIARFCRAFGDLGDVYRRVAMEE
jgi:hypothetical protein